MKKSNYANQKNDCVAVIEQQICFELPGRPAKNKSREA